MQYNEDEQRITFQDERYLTRPRGKKVLPIGLRYTITNRIEVYPMGLRYTHRIESTTCNFDLD